ncbi:hypothetical protein ACET3X_010013 [Alternaria dauci]|uniref:Uncharacterized protein n=1 Tax=Alternaria dauci TaxID=48095 RepID=A0ABR3U714_9PLEO
MANNRYHQLAGNELFNNEIHDSLKIELEKLNTDILPILNTISESSPQTQGSEEYVVDKEQYESITSAIGEITASCLDRLHAPKSRHFSEPFDESPEV